MAEYQLRLRRSKLSNGDVEFDVCKAEVIDLDGLVVATGKIVVDFIKTEAGALRECSLRFQGVELDTSGAGSTTEVTRS
jgi:hypothetical protein